MWKKRRYHKKSSGILVKFFLPVFILLIFIIIFFVFRIGFFNVKQVEVEGNLTCADQVQIKNSSDLFGQNFFFLNSSKTGNNLKKKFLCLRSITITKYLPNRIKLQVFERQPAVAFVTLKEKEASVSALIETSATPSADNIKDYYIVDDEGVVFSKEITGLNLSKIYIYDSKISLGQKLSNDLIGNALKILEKVRSFGMDIKTSLISDNFFIINNSAKPKIVFNLDNQINIQLASLQLILAEAKIDLIDLEFIDLRFDKPIIKVAPKKK